MVGLVGPDGVGKSTLLALIAGSKKLQHGSLTVLDGDIKDLRHRRAVGPRIAYMPQGVGQEPLSGAERPGQRRLHGAPLRAACRKSADHVSMSSSRPTGLAPFAARPAGKLSGGMKQKVGLCGALVHDPDLLILDEPTTGVDPLSRRQFWTLIDDIRAKRPGMSVLISTAYMDEAQKWDTIIAMDERTGPGRGDAGRADGANRDARFWSGRSLPSFPRRSAEGTPSSPFPRVRPARRRSPSKQTA